MFQVPFVDIICIEVSSRNCYRANLVVNLPIFGRYQRQHAYNHSSKVYAIGFDFGIWSKLDWEHDS